MNKLEIGLALDSLTQDVKRNAADLVRQYRRRGLVGVLKQGVDAPHRARAQVTAWIQDYNSRNGAGSAQVFLTSCLVAAGSTQTLASIDAELAQQENSAQVIVNHVNNDGWTWDQVATALESALVPEVVKQFEYERLPIPAGYTTVWGEPW